MDESRPLFSILIISLNPGQALAETLASIRAQQFADYEVVIKDGGSTDDIRETIRAYPGVRLQVAPDSGIFDAMNQAIDLARGRYLQFLNCGDTFYSEASLAQVADCIRRNPGHSLYYGDVHKPRSRSGFIRYPRKLSRYFIFNFPLCHQAWFVEASVYKAHRFETRSRIGGDDIWFKKMVGGGRISPHKIEEVIVTYEGGGTSEDPALQAESRLYRKAAKQSVFSAWEYALLTLAFKIRCFLKWIAYDSGVWRWVRRYRAWKQKKASE